FVIKFNGGDDGRGLVADQKVIAQAIDAVVPFMESEALLYAKDARYLNLRKDNVVGKRLYEPVIQHLLRRRKYPFHVERPGARGAHREANESRENRKENDQREHKQYSDARLIHGQRVVAHKECAMMLQLSGAICEPAHASLEDSQAGPGL